MKRSVSTPLCWLDGYSRIEMLPPGATGPPGCTAPAGLAPLPVAAGCCATQRGSVRIAVRKSRFILFDLLSIIDGNATPVEVQWQAMHLASQAFRHCGSA